MLEEVYSQTKEQMEKSIEALRRDYKTLRTGKVNVNILDNIKVDYYGTMTDLSQVGSVLATDATTITINPWEKNLLGLIDWFLCLHLMGILVTLQCLYNYLVVVFAFHILIPDTYYLLEYLVLLLYLLNPYH